jgi:quinol monooxygenase YgiN
MRIGSRAVIVVTGRVQIPTERRDVFLAIATEMCSASRGDDGCLGYRVYEDLEQPDRYVFIEEWRDDAALQSHFSQAHTTKFMAALLPMLGEPADALFHSVAETRVLEPGRGLVALD